ncbi:hypothetical protein [Catellatospora tritici]|uniref:hypothetical protein n=1 Tax=Catellatospora tritici TaxID=2851566 RepID=UPI001C2DD392|nr:hypothetical protein [Catellatospora tritici]MBV1855987.1 hypothetical protein [Catellatospora tritici]
MDRLDRVLTPMFDGYDRRRDKAQDWIDDTAGRPLRAWIAPILVAFTLTAAFVGLLRLLLAAADGFGPVGRWVVAAFIGTVALIMLAVVTRNVIVSLADPSQRRLLLIALITSGAGIPVEHPSRRRAHDRPVTRPAATVDHRAVLPVAAHRLRTPARHPGPPGLDRAPGPARPRRAPARAESAGVAADAVLGCAHREPC